jgi:hypothetical protein
VSPTTREHSRVGVARLSAARKHVRAAEERRALGALRNTSMPEAASLAGSA